MVKRIVQVLHEGRINPDAATFTANDMARAIGNPTGVPVNYRELGALLDRMGVAANRRDYRRPTDALMLVLPDWLEAAETATSSQIRLPTPTV